MAEEQKPEARGLNVSLGGQQSVPELQGILVQLGRIADQLQEMVKEMKSSPVRPQPFGSGQNVS